MSRESTTQDWYRHYYDKKGADRNDLRSNPGVLFQSLAFTRSIVRAMYHVAHDPRTAAVLDVGCGAADDDLFELLRLHYDPARITGIDILPERVAAARKVYPQMRLVEGDASRMEFADGSFDLVFESTMFATLPDNDHSAAIGREMVRVCKPGGYLFLCDWRIVKPGDPTCSGLTRNRVRRSFAVGRQTQWLGMYRGALVPPLGRFLSAWMPALYFPVRSCLPFLCGQVVYLLRKKEGT
jgi:ubiquinone/menaquinone biosynthesis C-methylase UbiE